VIFVVLLAFLKQKLLHTKKHGEPQVRQFEITYFAVTMALHYFQYLKESGKKEIAVLCDPDNHPDKTKEVVLKALENGFGTFLVGGSLVSVGNTRQCVRLIKELGAERVILFPGNETQIAEEADAILFLSLISGRNAEFLIGKHVHAAMHIKRSGLNTIPTAYMLVESGKLTSAQYMSSTMPLPYNKPDIAAATATAGELLGLQLFYLDAGSGADHPVPSGIIKAVSQAIDGPIFVGGGIRSSAEAEHAFKHGADCVVIGNGAFDSPELIDELAESLVQLNQWKA